MVAIAAGFKFLWCTFDVTKCFLVLFKMIKPNAFGILDWIIFLAEGAYSIYVFVIVNMEMANGCNLNSPLLWGAMVVCQVNAIIMIIKLVL